eukprot:s1196_g16.t1
MAPKKNLPWRCKTCYAISGGHANHCWRCGESWETAVDWNFKPQERQPQGQKTTQQPRGKSPRQQGRARSRKKHQQWHPEGQQDPDQGYGNTYWHQPVPVPYQQQWDGKGKGKSGPVAVPMHQASPPPPPPPMLMMPPMMPTVAQPTPQAMPWTPSSTTSMPSMPYMPPAMETTYQPTMTPGQLDPAVKEEQIAELKAQQKLNKIVKASKKEDNLSPEFQALMHEEQEKDNKEIGRSMHAAVTALQKAKEQVLEIENSRLQLMSQWKVFLHQSVAKWQEYTAQFQASEGAFQQQLQIATTNVKKAQRRFDVAKKRQDAVDLDDGTAVIISDEDADDIEIEELKKDENAERIHEGLQQVVTSLTVLSESADKLEPKAKRPRREDEIAPGDSLSSAAPPFWSGRHYVTDEYKCHRPLPVCDPDACVQHWSHSILKDETFISPWAAIEHATDLAFEMGSDEAIQVDVISLPLRRKSTARKVGFAERVQVYHGDEDIGKFQPINDLQTFHVNRDHCSSFGQLRDAVPHQCPGHPVHGDTGGSLPVTDGTSGAGQTNTHHFLDRALSPDIPNYIHHLQHLWRERDERIADDEVYNIRTWYVRSHDVPQWKIPRRCEVEGDGTTWHQDVLSAWRDVLLNHQRLTIAVVHPALRLPSPSHPIHADLVLVQGDPEWCGGLITVYPPNADDAARYTWAATLPRHLSGHDILRGADALHWIAHHPCQIYHDWQLIPVDDVPRHWMLNGHSFVVIFQDARADPSAASSSTPVVAHVHDQVLQEETPEEEAAPSETSFEQATGSHLEEDLHGLQIFGLGREPHHCFVRWATYNAILFDVLSSIGISSDQAVGYHYLLAPLIDQHEAEECIILQRVGDVPGGSPDRLLLVDVTIQHHEVAKTSYERRVRLLPRFMRREGFLNLLRLQAYCTWQDDRCIVYYNNEVWGSADLAPRQTEHGAYLRVVVLAPEDKDIDTHQAIQIAEAEHESIVERPTKMQRSAAACATTSPGTVRGPALFQIRTHSYTRPGLGPAPGELQRPATRTPHPKQLNAEKWILQAGMAFLEQACTEYPEEGPVIVWNTWFLHTRRYRQNSESRLLRLDVEQHLWYQDLCELWEDVIDPTVHFVHPSPPRATHQVHAGHLILLQGEDDHVPVLLSGLFQHEFNNRLWHLASLVPEYMTGQQLCDALETDRWCGHRLCYVQCGGDLVELDHYTHVQPGDSVLITITTVPRPIATTTDEEAHALMQRFTRRWSRPASHVRQSAFDVPGGQDECQVFSFNPLARPFFPGRAIPSLDTQSEDIQDLYHLWDETAFSWEGEERSCLVAVWFVDHRWHQPHGHQFRTARLWSDYTRWADVITRTWHDHLIPGAWLEWQIVMPKPFTQDNAIAAHVIIIQNPRESWVTNIVTIVDAEHTDFHPRQLAVTTHEHILLDNILRVCQLYDVCLTEAATHHCFAWYGMLQMWQGHPVMGRSGTSIQCQLRPRQRVTPTNDGPVLLQLHALLQRSPQDHVPCARLTHGSVAHDHGPQEGTIETNPDFPAVGACDDLCGFSEEKILIELISTPGFTLDQIGLPPFFEVPTVYDIADIQTELQAWRFSGRAHLCRAHHALFIEVPDDPPACTVYCHDDPTIVGGIHVTCHHEPKDMIGHMRHLYTLGFPKAVVLRVEQWSDSTVCVHFTNVEPSLDLPAMKLRTRTPWPERQPRQTDFTCPIRPTTSIAIPNCRLEIDQGVLHDFFHTGPLQLFTDVDIFDLPDFVKEMLAECRPVEKADRYIIYTDGSSQCRQKHKPPLWIEEFDTSDSWCFAVFKEQCCMRLIARIMQARLMLALTLRKQKPCCGAPYGDYHSRIDFRLGQQAAGLIGSSATDGPFRHMRAAFQALEALLPADHLRIEHTRSHAGDPGNELVDYFAKLEARQSLYLPRQKVDFRHFAQILSHLWMIFTPHDDVPPFYGAGFDLTAPLLPTIDTPVDSQPSKSSEAQVHFTLSFASANVCTFYRGAEGVPGKIDYVRLFTASLEETAKDMMEWSYGSI